MKKIAITIAALFTAAFSFGQTIEKSQAEMIYDVVPSVAPCIYCSEMIFVMADTSEYRWDGDSWELWDNGVRWSLEQDSIRVGYKFGIEYARDTIRTPGSGGGGGATNLAYTASATDGTITSDTGTDATIPAGSTTNASLMLPADKTKLDGIESGATADQNSSEVELSAPITGLPASTDVHEALTELATNATVADQLIGDLITLSGVPITSQNLGVFTGTTITDDNTIKGALQESETSLELKVDSFTLVMAADTSYYVFTQYNTSTGAFQIDTLWQRAVSGGGGGIGGTLSDNAVPKYDDTAGEFVDSGLSDNDTTLTVDRHIKQQRTYYPSTLRTTTAGSDTIIIVNTGIQRLCPSVTFVYVRLSYFDQQTATLAQQGTISCRFRIDNAGATPQDGYIQVMGDWNVSLEGKVGYSNTTDEAVISFRGPNARYIVERIDFTTDAADFDPDNISITGVSTEAGYTLSSAEMTNRAFVIGAQAEGQEFDGNVVGLSISNTNTGGTDNSVSFHMIPSYGPDASGQDLTRGVILQARKNSAGSGSGNDLAILLPQTQTSDNPLERMVLTGEGRLGINSLTPQYSFVLGASNAAMQFNPHNTTLTGAEGLLFWRDADNTLNGHNGTDFFRFMQQSDVLPTSGQVGVFNSTTGLYEPTTLTTGTMSSFNIESDDFTLRSIGDGDNVSLLGENGIISRDGVVPGEVYYGLDLESIPNSVTLDGDESFLFFDELDVAEYKIDIDFIKDYINSGVATSSIYTGSDTIPDFTSAKTALGAGLEFADDNFSLTGDVFFPDVLTESVHTVLGLSSTNKLVEYTPQDTIFIPIYAHPHDEAITTGSADYRGWRVPADLNGAKIEAIQYSFDTPGSDTVTIQLTNGTINVAGATIPALGYVENTAVSQTLTTGEKWTPTIGTINGTGHEGLMVNLMIVR